MDYIKGFINRHKLLVKVFSIVVIFIPQYVDSVWGLAERFRGGSITMHDITWAYWITVPIGGTMFGIAMWVIRKEAEEHNTRPLQDIKKDLLMISTYERDVATEKANQKCPKKTAEQIYEDWCSIRGRDFHKFIVSIIQSVVVNHDLDPLINFFKEIGDILDSNGYGLKVELQKNEAYKSYRMDVAQKRLNLKAGKKKSTIIQKNIDRVYSLTYGLNSSIVLRAIFNSMPKAMLEAMPEAKRKALAVIRVTFESIETETDKVLNAMLNDLEKEWKVTISGQQRRL